MNFGVILLSIYVLTYYANAVKTDSDLVFEEGDIEVGPDQKLTHSSPTNTKPKVIKPVDLVSINTKPNTNSLVDPDLAEDNFFERLGPHYDRIKRSRPDVDLWNFFKFPTPRSGDSDDSSSITAAVSQNKFTTREKRNTVQPESSGFPDTTIIPSPEIAKRTKCKADEFSCDDGHCILSIWQCDGTVDCRDFSDEIGCPPAPTTAPKAITTTTLAPLKCLPNDFVCKDGSCVDGASRCDNKVDCGDLSDELDCPRNCRSNEFQCDDRHCVPLSRKCDQIPDCRDGSDELNCPKCKPNEFSCDDGHCILSIRQCDGTVDCRDFSDEVGCPPAPTTTTTTTTTPAPRCTVGEFRCQEGHCIPDYRRCDGAPDCRDYTDEIGCPPPTPRTTTTEDPILPPRNPYCRLDQFTCVYTRECVPLTARCDDQSDCLDRSDEMNCTGNQLSLRAYPTDQIIKERNCRSNEFQCDDRHCVLLNRKCDQIPDCRDGSDELNCPTCNADEFECSDGRCVLKIRHCDGIADCRDFSDEIGCTTRTRRCAVGEFHCLNGDCIPNRQRCDGAPDCRDNTDEIGCPRDHRPTKNSLQLPNYVYTRSDYISHPSYTYTDQRVYYNLTFFT